MILEDIVPKDIADVPSAASFGTKGAEYVSFHIMCGHLRALCDIDTKRAEGVRFQMM